jgi:protocatechuate 3,4-dioxygenase beta subunit
MWGLTVLAAIALGGCATAPPGQAGPGACDWVQAGALTVSVTDTQGAPAAEVLVEVKAVGQVPTSGTVAALSCAGASSGGKFRTNAAGQLTFDRLRPGDYSVALVDAPTPADGYVRVTDKQTSKITLTMGAARP